MAAVFAWVSTAWLVVVFCDEEQLEKIAQAAATDAAAKNRVGIALINRKVKSIPIILFFTELFRFSIEEILDL
jgi:hypothetical protein